MPDLLEYARGYLDRGWSIIPVGSNKAPPPGVRWKRYQTSRAKPETLERWFARADVTGMAVVLGDVSGGLCCRDFDIMDSYDEWAQAHPDLARTLPTVETARGRHVYFRGRAGSVTKYADGELRCGGSYCILPPSRHPSGVEYQWVVPPPPGDLPFVDPVAAHLVASVTQQAEQTEQTQQTEQTKAIGEPVKREPNCVHSAIVTTIPGRPGERNSRIWQLARALKAVDWLRDKPAGFLRPVIIQWHNLARHRIGTKPFDESWADFTWAWPRVRHAMGEGPMDMILERALASEPPAEALIYESEETRLLAKVCRELQVNAGGDPFFLSTRKASECLEGGSPMKALRLLRMFCEDGLLEVVQRGTPGPESRKATRYRYLGRLE